MGRRVAILSSAAGALLAAVAAAGAQVPQVRFARQFSMSYLQFNLMERQHLVEKHAKAAGIAQVKVLWATFNSPAAMNDALLSGSVDFVSGGVPGLPTIWSRTLATGAQVKWTMVPESTMQLATFMHSVGSIKAMPSSWKDLFFPEIHALSGG